MKLKELAEGLISFMLVMFFVLFWFVVLYLSVKVIKLAWGG